MGGVPRRAGGGRDGALRVKSPGAGGGGGVGGEGRVQVSGGIELCLANVVTRLGERCSQSAFITRHCHRDHC